LVTSLVARIYGEAKGENEALIAGKEKAAGNF
jgi:hypothetical protein